MEYIIAFFIAVGIVVLFWCLLGLLLIPVFGNNMVTLCFVKDDAVCLEQQVRSYGWLREGRMTGGRLYLIDLGLTDLGRKRAEALTKQYEWVTMYCGPVPAEWMPEMFGNKRKTI